MNNGITNKILIKNIEKIVYNFYSNICLIFGTMILMLIGFYFEQMELPLFAIIILWVYAILFGLLDIDNRFMGLLFIAMFFVFLISRPFIALMFNIEWQYWDQETTKKALTIIYLGLLGVYLTYYYGENVKDESLCVFGGQKKYNKEKIHVARLVLFTLVCVTGTVYYYIQISRYSVLQNYDYALLYTDSIDFGSTSIVENIMITMFPYSVFTYLALMPEKKKSIIVLLIYIGSGIPMFIVGSRFSLILPIVFATVYFLLRNKLDTEGTVWVSPRMKLFFVIFCCLAVFYLGLANYIREDKSFESSYGLNVVEDFFYKQGTTYDTLCQGIEYENKIRALSDVKNYTFGSIIDSFANSKITKSLFGTKDRGKGNSLLMIKNGSSMADNLSYVVLGEKEYLTGHGRGTSYLLETYYDGGFIFVFVFSFVLGLILNKTLYLFRKGNIFINILILTMLSNIFSLPRRTSTIMLSFVTAPHFWTVIIICAVCFMGVNYDILFKRKILKRRFLKEQ